jgi:hypothetical protein
VNELTNLVIGRQIRVIDGYGIVLAEIYTPQFSDMATFVLPHETGTVMSSPERKMI